LILVLTLFAGCGDNKAVSSVTSGETASVEEIPMHLTRENEQKPFVVVNRYNKDDIFVATIDVTKAPYYADNTGKTDATQAIQMAMTHACGYYNGGVVYLPSGTYKISAPLNIQSTVTLRGEYNPDCLKTGDYGTVLSIEHTATAVNMNKSTGIHGISFYYPNQSIENPTEADYTIRGNIGGHTLQDICFINSYKGVQFGQQNGSAYGWCYFKNVYGTVLYLGVAFESAGDAMFGDGLHLSPDYWIKGGSRYNAPTETALRAWMLENSLCGVSMAGCESSGITNGLIDGYKNGFYVPQSTRMSGTDTVGTYAHMYEVDIINTVNAVNTPSIYWDMAIEFAKSRLEGSSNAVLNTSSYPVKLFNCTVKGVTSGNVVQTSDDVVLPDIKFPYVNPAKKDLIIVTDYDGIDPTGKKDSSGAIQKALNDAKANGGGYVYLPGGVYRIEKPLTVYEGTELRGTSASYVSAESGMARGTIFHAYYGKNEETALITLAGNGSGIKGIAIYYPKNGLKIKNETLQMPDEYSPMVRGTADNVYSQFVVGYAGYRGFEMVNADNFFLEFSGGGFYKNTITAENCKGGVVHSGASSGHNVRSSTFSYWPDFSETATNAQLSELGDYMEVYFVNFLTKIQDPYIIKDSEDITLVTTGMYRAHRFLIAKNSEVIAINQLASRSGAQNYAYEIEGGKLLAVNTMLKDITVLKADNKAKYGIYNNKGQIMPVGVSEDNYVRK